MLIKIDFRFKDMVYVVQNKGRYLFQIDMNGIVLVFIIQVMVIFSLVFSRIFK